MNRPQYVTPVERIAELVAEHGSLRKAAAATGVSLGHLWEIGSGRQPIETIKIGTILRLGLACGPTFKRT